jgi:hypothetical protein
MNEIMSGQLGRRLKLVKRNTSDIYEYIVMMRQLNCSGSSECSVGQEQHGNNGDDIYLGCGSSEPPYHDSSWSHRVMFIIIQLLMRQAAEMVRKKLSYGHPRSSPLITPSIY